jgi:glycerol uptake facilitator protein
MSPFTAELLGTALLILLGDCVVANVVLKQTKGHAGGLIAITTGWAFAVAVAVYAFGDFSGGHFNPAVTIAMAALGKLSPALVPTYIAAQMLGAILGATLVWLAYLPHWAVTEAKADKLGVFCTAPAIRHTVGNLISEIIGTAVLVLGALAISKHFNDDKGWANGAGPMLVGVVVWSIGLSLGGPTGYAINPARDLGPRIAHAILPISGKGSNDWGYAWIPVVGPIIGGLIAALIFKSFWA